MQNSIKLSNKRPKKLNFLPKEPGIYQFIDSKKEVIYIGKAKNLEKRVKYYFSKSKGQSKKVKRLSGFSLRFLKRKIKLTKGRSCENRDLLDL